MKILMVGDIVGSPGRRAFAHTATRLRQQGAVDFIVANAENAAGGRGVTAILAEELFAAGANVLTLGDHTWTSGILPPTSTVSRAWCGRPTLRPDAPAAGGPPSRATGSRRLRL
jgi:calcineurin-like phosphoesterase